MTYGKLVFVAVALASTVGCLVASAGGAVADEPAALRSEIAVPVAKEPTLAELDKTAEQQWHRLTLRLDGSMCPACLIQLEDRLRKLPAVGFAKVNREDGHERKRASAIIIYDAHALKFDRIKECISKESYKATDVDDKPMTDVATEATK